MEWEIEEKSNMTLGLKSKRTIFYTGMMRQVDLRETNTINIFLLFEYIFFILIFNHSGEIDLVNEMDPAAFHVLRWCVASNHAL